MVGLRVVSGVMDGGDRRPQTLAGHSRAEAEVAHDVNEMGVEAHVREVEKAVVDPCRGRCVTRASVNPEGQVRILRF